MRKDQNLSKKGSQGNYKDQNLCSVSGCRNNKEKGRTICSKHSKQKYRKENAMRASYQNLKDNSKRRKKEFNLTFEEFKIFCVKTNYLVGKGRNKDGYTIDRIDDEKGYAFGNIRMLKNEDNLAKENKRRKILKYNYEEKVGIYTEIKQRDTSGDEF